MNEDQEQRIQNQFGSFCTRVLKNEIRYIHREFARKRNQEILFSEMLPDELEKISQKDDYFQDEFVFEVLGNQIVVTDEILGRAITSLSKQNRDVILLSYYMGMSDNEISNLYNVVRQAITKKRTNSLRKLREYFEKEGLA